MGKRSPLGTKKRVLAGGGDPFSLREGKIPPAADEALVPLAAALSRQCSDKRCTQLAAFQNVGTGLDFDGRHWRAKGPRQWRPALRPVGADADPATRLG